MLTSWPLVGRSRELELLGGRAGRRRAFRGGARRAGGRRERPGWPRSGWRWPRLEAGSRRGSRAASPPGACPSAPSLPSCPAPPVPASSRPTCCAGHGTTSSPWAEAGRSSCSSTTPTCSTTPRPRSSTSWSPVARRSCIATVRTEEPAPDPIVALWKDELAERLELQPLDPAASRPCSAPCSAGRSSGATLHGLGERSAGNALYLRELVLAGVESGALTNQDGIWRLSGLAGGLQPAHRAHRGPPGRGEGPRRESCWRPSPSASPSASAASRP